MTNLEKDFLRLELLTYIKISLIQIAKTSFNNTKIILLGLMLEIIIEFPLPLLFLKNKPYSNDNNTNKNLKPRL